jgi:mono/diheme cytochrome c family protein
MKRLIISNFLLLLVGVACSSPEELKHKQYVAEGFELYKRHCANCHQTDGKGLGNLYPPINGSDYLANNRDQIAHAIRYGQTGSVVVNGKTYTQPMPANSRLTDMEIEEILAFVYDEWGGSEKSDK